MFSTLSPSLPSHSQRFALYRNDEQSHVPILQHWVYEPGSTDSDLRKRSLRRVQTSIMTQPTTHDGLSILATGIDRSLGVFPRPLTRSVLISGTIGLVGLRNFWNERVVWIRVCEQRAYGQKHLRHCQRRAPLVPKNIQAYAPIGVDVRMINPGCERDLRRLERVVSREVNGQEIDPTGVRRIRLEATNRHAMESTPNDMQG